MVQMGIRVKNCTWLCPVAMATVANTKAHNYVWVQNPEEEDLVNNLTHKLYPGVKTGPIEMLYFTKSNQYLIKCIF